LIAKILKEDKKYRANKNLAKYAIRFIWAEEFKNFKPLFNDKSISLIAVWASHYNYHYLSEDLKKDIDITKIYITSLVNDWESSEKIWSFIESQFSDNKNNQLLLEKHYKQIIKQTWQIYIKDINKCLITLEIDHSKYITELLEKKILLKEKKTYTFSPDFIEELSLEINQISESLDKNNRDKQITQIIKDRLAIPNNILNKYTDFLISTLKKNLNISKKSKENKQENIDESVAEILNNSENKPDNIREEDKNTIQSDLVYFYPECSYTLSSWNYNIEILWSSNIVISEEEMKDFTSVALKNFIKFYWLLYDTGLSFLWDKYRSDFITLCNNKVWLDYKTNEGITQWKSLSILNIIGKSIGVPQTVIESHNKEEDISSEMKCFKTLADAKLVFWDIKSSWKVNNNLVMQPGTFSSYSIIEAHMIETNLIDQKSNTINLSKFL
jgi:hypothetical protein